MGAAVAPDAVELDPVPDVGRRLGDVLLGHVERRVVVHAVRRRVRAPSGRRGLCEAGT